MPDFIKPVGTSSICQTIALVNETQFTYFGSGQATIKFNNVVVATLSSSLGRVFDVDVAGDYLLCIRAKSCAISILSYDDIIGGGGAVGDVSTMAVDPPNRTATHTAGGASTSFITGIDLSDANQIANLITALSAHPDTVVVNDAFGNPLYQALPL